MYQQIIIEVILTIVLSQVLSTDAISAAIHLQYFPL